MIALRFYCSYNVRCKKPKGASYEFRTQNFIRQHLTFGSLLGFERNSQNAKSLVSGFLCKYFPCMNLKMCISKVAEAQKKIAKGR